MISARKRLGDPEGQYITHETKVNTYRWEISHSKDCLSGWAEVVINYGGLSPVTLPYPAWEDLCREAESSNNADIYCYWYVSGFLDMQEGRDFDAGNIPAYQHGASVAYQLGEMHTSSNAAMGDSYDYEEIHGY